MASSYEGEREDDGPGRCWDLPFEGKDAAREDNHRRKHEKTDRASQNRRRIRGTSMKKFDRSTSFFVAPHVMLYEKRCASSASDKWIDKPPKKKKLLSVPMRNAISLK